MERFIEAVRQCPCLWDVSNKDYRNIDKKEAAWKIIADYLKLPGIKDVKEAKAEWKKLRDSHRDSLKRMKTKPSQVQNTWKHAEAMEFLLPHMKKRSPYTRNYNTQQSSDTAELGADEDSNQSDTSAYSRNDTVNSNTEADVSQGSQSETRKRKANTDLTELFREMEQKQEFRDMRMPNAQKDKDAIDLFMESMAMTIKAMPTWVQSRIKRKIFLIVSDAEEEFENYSTSGTADNYGYRASGETPLNNIPAAGPSHHSLFVRQVAIKHENTHDLQSSADPLSKSLA